MLKVIGKLIQQDFQRTEIFTFRTAMILTQNFIYLEVF